MKQSAINVYLNRFPVKKLSESDKTVQVYSCNFKSGPEPGKEYAAMNRIPWNIGKTTGVRFGSKIITKQVISETYLNNELWTLKYEGTQYLNPQKENERNVLERLERRWVREKLAEISGKYKVEQAFEGGLIWWNTDRKILQDSGWEVHKGIRLDLELHSSGVILVEIDTHHCFYSPWTLEQWLQKYQDIPISWVCNTYNNKSWKLNRFSEQAPEQIILPTGENLADYHRKLPNKPATEVEIINSRVVYVINNNQEIPHLSSRLRPSITMEILSSLKEKGSKEAAKVFAQTRQSIHIRFDEASNTAKLIAKNIYQIEQKVIETKVKSQNTKGIIFRSKSPLLLTKSSKVHRPIKSLDLGCYATGEKEFGCINLIDNSGWSKFVTEKLENIAKSSNIELVLENAKNSQDLPDTSFKRQQFWQHWSNKGIKTVLVISNWLQNPIKNQYQKEALEANIALQFMQPMYQLDEYRLANIILGLLLKAKWQPVGLEPIKDEYVSEIVIGFDAGTNRQMYYGTSAFAILANGQSLGWELPEAQPGEKLNGQAVWRTVSKIINRFEAMENRLPQRILLLRDGIVQADEFEDTVGALRAENIAIDLLSVRKSGAGRMAMLPYQSEFLIDASPGTAILSADGNTFRIVTSEAKAGGSARPLQVVRDCGDAPLEILARQIDRLSMLNPCSAYSYSRLPYVLHFADKMAKTVQSLGGISILQQVDRHKIFFA